MKILCNECGSAFNSEGELRESRDFCVRTGGGCPMAHSESCLVREWSEAGLIKQELEGRNEKVRSQ